MAIQTDVSSIIYPCKLGAEKLYHRMWTPTEIAYDYPQSNERPYAGLLEFESYTGAFSPSLAQKNWLTLGVIGPASFADEMQTFVHKITGSTSPKGWDYQIENQMTYQLAYEVDALLSRQQAFENSQWEISVYNHTMAGNLRSQSSLGLTLRWGDDLAETLWPVCRAKRGTWGIILLRPINMAVGKLTLECRRVIGSMT